MSCSVGYDDCRHEGDKCDLCFNGFHYEAKPQRKQYGLRKTANKQDGRMGSSFEFSNHQKIENTLNGTTTRMTPNSGAGRIKGDQEIRGLVTVMEELKTKVAEQVPGKQTFTLQKKWLEKLHREATAANKEIWYLKFCFHETENEDYVVVEADQILSMVYTLVEDRKKAIAAQRKIETAERRADLEEAKNVVTAAKIAYLEALLKQNGIDFKE